MTPPEEIAQKIEQFINRQSVGAPAILADVLGLMSEAVRALRDVPTIAQREQALEDAETAGVYSERGDRRAYLDGMADARRLLGLPPKP